MKRKAERRERLTAMLDRKSRAGSPGRCRRSTWTTAVRPAMTCSPSSQPLTSTSLLPKRAAVIASADGRIVVSGAERKKSGRVRAHPVRERLRRVDLHAQDQIRDQKTCRF